MLIQIVKKKPALFYGTIQTFITLLVTFGLDLTTAQVGAILACVQSIIMLITDASTTSSSEMVKHVEVALNTNVNGDTDAQIKQKAKEIVKNASTVWNKD